MAGQELCHALVKLAQEQDTRMPDMQPTHLLLLYYASQDGMCWHSDSDKNDGDNDHPIVSITVGTNIRVIIVSHRRADLALVVVRRECK